MKEIREGHNKGNLRSPPKTKRPSMPPAAHRPARQEGAKDQLRECLAKFIHEDSWAHWMKYLWGCCEHIKEEYEDVGPGDVIIPAEKAKRWRRQMKTTYEDLPEKEKESDRNLANKLMKLLEED